MNQKNQNYRCSLCGQVVEVLHPTDSALMCCGREMYLLVENSVDASTEKHVPIVEKIDNGVRISVGSVPHPMEENHFIEWIEAVEGDLVFRQNFKPGDRAIAEFPISGESEITVRAYCNLHGLWKSA